MKERRYWFPKAYADRVQKLRVIAGFIMVAAFIYAAAPTLMSMSAGTPIAAAGVVLRAWAAGHLEKNMNLAMSGPYARVRNPLYVGTLLTAAGFAVASNRWQLGLLFGMVFILIYLPVIELEEQHLRSLFPKYADYAKRVPVLIPSLTGAPATGRFRWSVYRKNEEFQAAIGFLLGVAILVIKHFFFR